VVVVVATRGASLVAGVAVPIPALMPPPEGSAACRSRAAADAAEPDTSLQTSIDTTASFSDLHSRAAPFSGEATASFSDLHRREAPFGSVEAPFGSVETPFGSGGAPFGTAEATASFSDLHRRAAPFGDAQASFSELGGWPVVDSCQQAEAACEAAAAPADDADARAGLDACGELSETAALLRVAILLKLEEDELTSTARELRSRLAAEREEIGRLRDTIQEMETLYKYRTYSVDSSDDSSGEDSEDSDTEEDLLRQLIETACHNQQGEAKNAQLVRAIHEERRCCQRRRAQIRYLELQQRHAT